MLKFNLKLITGTFEAETNPCATVFQGLWRPPPLAFCSECLVLDRLRALADWKGFKIELR